MRYHLTLVRMDSTQKMEDYKCWLRCGEKGACSAAVGSHHGNRWSFQKTLKVQIHDLSIPASSTYPKEMKSVCPRDDCAPIIFTALFIIAKKGEVLYQCSSIDRKTAYCLSTMGYHGKVESCHLWPLGRKWTSLH